MGFPPTMACTCLPTGRKPSHSKKCWGARSSKIPSSVERDHALAPALDPLKRVSHAVAEPHVVSHGDPVVRGQLVPGRAGRGVRSQAPGPAKRGAEAGAGRRVTDRL